MNKQEKYDWMVYVCCFTYNHGPYIEETLNGFTMQKTTFPYVCCIVDDASTDGEQEVVKNYLNEYFDLEDGKIVRHEETDDYISIFARHKANKNCFFAVFYLKYNHYKKKRRAPYLSRWCDRAKYTALCEGDDYWIESEKLQRQVGFMECHPEHSLCFCAHRELFPSGQTKDVVRYVENNEICPIEDVIVGGGDYMATNSMFYRNSLYVPYTTWAHGCPVGDLPLMLTLAHMGKVGYMADVMCVYRKSVVGSWSERKASSWKFRRNHYHAMIEMWHQFDEWSDRKYHETILKKIRKNMVNHYKSEVKSLVGKILNKWKY